ncbi:MAG TPA: glycosyltransferase family 39 protein [Thermoanaerobaculia bacterium]|nr:glycosyltransferase family 39 protein [Thermoanaerobaculia bacterium]
MLLDWLTAPLVPLTDRQKRGLLGATMVVIATRWWALSASLWDWDEVLFAAAMRDYDVTAHRPHPPGFPLFILLAKLIRPLVESEFHALRMISFVASAVLFPALFALGRQLRMPYAPAIFGAALTSFVPTVWVYGGTAFSDVPSLVLVVTAVCLLLRGCRSSPAFLAGALVLGIAAGFRPQSLLIGLVPSLLAAWFALKRREWIVPFGALLLVAGISAGSYAGAARATGSWSAYSNAVRSHQQYIAKVDSFRNSERPPLHKLVDDFFVRSYRATFVNYVLSFLVLVSVAAALATRDARMMLLVACFGPFALAAWLLLDHLSVSRFAIGYMPMLTLLSADGAWRFAGALEHRLAWSRDRAMAIIGAGIVVALVAHAVPAIRVVRGSASPPAAALDWIEKNLDPARARIFVTGGMIPFAEHGLRGYRLEIVEDDRAIPMESRSDGSAYLLAEGAHETALNFHRRRNGALWNIVRHRYFEVSLMPLVSAARFGEGWHESENHELSVWRWMGRRSVTELPPLEGRGELTLTFEAPLDSLDGAPTITVAMNGTILDAFRLTEGSATKRYVVASPRTDGVNTLTIETDRVVNPLRQGLAADARDLGLKLIALSWGPAD